MVYMHFLFTFTLDLDFCFMLETFRSEHLYLFHLLTTITKLQEDKLSKATSSLFPIKTIAILEWT